VYGLASGALLTSMKRVRKRANCEEETHGSEQNDILHRGTPLSHEAKVAKRRNQRR